MVLLLWMNFMVYESAQYEKAQATGKIGAYDYIKNFCSLESLITFSCLRVLRGAGEDM